MLQKDDDGERHQKTEIQNATFADISSLEDLFRRPAFQLRQIKKDLQCCDTLIIGVFGHPWGIKIGCLIRDAQSNLLSESGFATVFACRE